MHKCVFSGSILALLHALTFASSNISKCSDGSSNIRLGEGNSKRHHHKMSLLSHFQPFFPLPITLSIPVLKVKRRDIFLRAGFCFKVSIYFLSG